MILFYTDNMRIGFLMPSIFMAKKFSKDRIFAPGDLARQLVNGLVDCGHEVFFYTAADVESYGKVIAGDKDLLEKELNYYLFRNRSVEEKTYTTSEIRKRDYEYALTLRAYKDAKEGKIDIIHSFHDFGAHYFNELTKFPTVYTLHDPMPPADSLEYYRLKRFSHHNYISISDRQRVGMDLHFVATIHHGIDISSFAQGRGKGKYLLYFGRILKDKAPHEVIRIGKKLGIPVKIASSQNSANRDREYYETQIKPFIDGRMVSEVGFLEGQEKAKLIGDALAFVFPLQWEEPFGLVLIESMACGTPVVAYNRGSVSELVIDGSTGYVIDKNNEEGLEAAVEKIRDLSTDDYNRMRQKCREHVQNHFITEKMVEAHIKVYSQVLAG